jgi:hypothetical protein
VSRAALLAALFLTGACNHAEPPSRPDTSAASAGSTARPHRRVLSKPHKPLRDAAPASDIDAASGATEGGLAFDAGLDAGPDASPSLAASKPPPLFDADGRLLPQTDEEPSATSPWFKAGIDALFRAIQRDDPALAEPFFFPKEAYGVVKDVQDPGRDWERRLLSHFRRDVHDYHAKLGADAADAELVGIELALANKRWMKPRSEGNRIGYYRVTHSKLRYRSRGRERALEVTSFISWRGEWYLVHLNGFE